MYLFKGVANWMNGEEVAFAVFPPNWKDGVEVKMQSPSESVSSIDQLGFRRPKANSLRLSLSYTTLIKPSEVEEFKDFFLTLGNTKCVMPFWPDVRYQPNSDGSIGWLWEGRIFKNDLCCAWGSWVNGALDYSDIVFGYEENRDKPLQGLSGPPYHQYNAPCIMGRFSKPKFVSLNDGVFTMKINFIEESPYKCRLIPIRQCDTWYWLHNWKSNQEVEYINSLSYKQLGEGRLTVEDGSGVTYPTVSQTLGLKGEDLYNFVGFFHGMKGDVKTFATDLNPGPSEEYSAYLLYCRVFGEENNVPALQAPYDTSALRRLIDSSGINLT